MKQFIENCIMLPSYAIPHILSTTPNAVCFLDPPPPPPPRPKAKTRESYKFSSVHPLRDFSQNWLIIDRARFFGETPVGSNLGKKGQKLTFQNVQN